MTALHLTSNYAPMRSQPGEPTWEIALLYPTQGNWSENEYLELTKGNWMVEFTDGRLEVLPMPTLYHQLIVRYLFSLLERVVRRSAEGEVLFAPLPVRLDAGRMYREPDIVYLRPERMKDLHGQPEGADLAMEVVSLGREARERDLVEKRRDYAAAGVAEYWIVDPQERVIEVLTLDGEAYKTHGRFAAGERATSVLLTGFAVGVDEVFSVGGNEGEAE